MKNTEVSLNPNKLVQCLQKPANEFTREDIIKFVEGNNIQMLNLRYVAEDGKLKMLNFAISSKEHLETLLSTGERVDGSNLFSYVEAGSSDLYVIPRFKTAFLSPFTEVPTLDILCSFYNSEGKPLESAPEYILRKAHNEFKKETGLTLKALGELEYYVEGEKIESYEVADQKGYHTSAPFSKWDTLRIEALKLISEAGGKIKYGHSEVGNFTDGDFAYEQHEIEFLPVDIEDAADQLAIAKWIVRMLGYIYNVNVSFAPKITVGKAGSGMHFHVLAEKDSENIMIKDCKLSDEAKKIIAGILDLASPLTAFGNTLPTSYLRLVPHQEAPTSICWGDRNRSALIRVPLGWVAKTQMIKDANPQQKADIPYIPGKQTVELRSPDGSADIHYLLAGICVAAQHGSIMENALEFAEKLYVDVDIFEEEHKRKLKQLDHLPASCWESAESLEKHREVFEKNGIFPKGTIDNIIHNLKAFKDEDLRERLYGKKNEIKKLVRLYLHCK